MNHVIPHHLFLPYYVSNYGWMCLVFFCCYFYSFILYRDFFPWNEQVCTHLFSFSSSQLCSIFVSSILLSNLRQNGKKLSFLTSRLVILLLFLQTSSFPSHSQPWPKGDPCCTDTLFLSKNLNAGPLALHETGHVYWAEPGSRSHNPPHYPPRSCLVISRVSRRLCELKGDPVCRCTVIVFTLWEGWGLRGREGEGKWRISYWSSARRMGVLYNVELVNCVLWCKDDGNELLFLFYDLSVSVKWITAIYSESKLVCIIVTLIEQKS